MIERWIHSLRIEDAGEATIAQTRERLKPLFPAGATRRMTHLGMVLGATINPLCPGEEDAVVYASTFSEVRAVEDYLDGFPSASPTLFQTSIHPSAVQQNLIQRQQPVRRFYPVTGGAGLISQALLVALLEDAPRVILCGGEERGGWLLEAGKASRRTFAFALALSPHPDDAIGRVSLSQVADSAAASDISTETFFTLLRDRRKFDGATANGRRLVLEWNP